LCASITHRRKSYQWHPIGVRLVVVGGRRRLFIYWFLYYIARPSDVWVSYGKLFELGFNPVFKRDFPVLLICSLLRVEEFALWYSLNMRFLLIWIFHVNFSSKKYLTESSFSFHSIWNIWLGFLHKWALTNFCRPFDRVGV